MPIHPLSIFYLFYFAFHNSIIQCCSEDERDKKWYIAYDYPRSRHIDASETDINNSFSYIEATKELNLYVMSNCPPTLNYLLVMYLVKAILFITLFVPLMWFPLLIFCIALMCHIIQSEQKAKISLCIIAFLAIMFGVHFWINVYRGHMVVPSVVRAFLGIDQCPNGVTANLFDNFIISNHYHFNNIWEFLVWVKYWII